MRYVLMRSWKQEMIEDLFVWCSWTDAVSTITPHPFMWCPPGVYISFSITRPKCRRLWNESPKWHFANGMCLLTLSAFRLLSGPRCALPSRTIVREFLLLQSVGGMQWGLMETHGDGMSFKAMRKAYGFQVLPFAVSFAAVLLERSFVHSQLPATPTGLFMWISNTKLGPQWLTRLAHCHRAMTLKISHHCGEQFKTSSCKLPPRP